jgi:hypothetical protein
MGKRWSTIEARIRAAGVIATDPAQVDVRRPLHLLGTGTIRRRLNVRAGLRHTGRLAPKRRSAGLRHRRRGMPGHDGLGYALGLLLGRVVTGADRNRGAPAVRCDRTAVLQHVNELMCEHAPAGQGARRVRTCGEGDVATDGVRAGTHGVS